MSNNSAKVLDDVTDDTTIPTDTDATATESGGTPDTDSTATDTANDKQATADGAAVTTPVSTDKAGTADGDTAPAATTARLDWPRLRARMRRWVPAVAVLLIVGLGVATGYLGWQYREAKAIDDASAAALRAANSYAVTLTSVDTANLDANFQAVLDGSAGEFRDAYTQSSTQLRQLLIDHKAVGRGVVLQSAVKSATAEEVVVLLFVDQTVTNTELPDPRIDRSRIVMTMRHVDGQWKATKVDIP